MFIERLLDNLKIRSPLLNLIVGAALVALVVALGTAIALSLLGYDNRALPAILAAIAAALFAARRRQAAEKPPAAGGRQPRVQDH